MPLAGPMPTDSTVICPAHKGLEPIHRSFIKGVSLGAYYGERVWSTQVKSHK